MTLHVSGMSALTCEQAKAIAEFIKTLGIEKCRVLGLAE